MQTTLNSKNTRVKKINYSLTFFSPSPSQLVLRYSPSIECYYSVFHDPCVENSDAITSICFEAVLFVRCGKINEPEYIRRNGNSFILERGSGQNKKNFIPTVNPRNLNYDLCRLQLSSHENSIDLEQSHLHYYSIILAYGCKVFP